MDPLADTFQFINPYNYVFNTPLRFTDSDGQAPDDIIILTSAKGISNLFFGHAAVLVGNNEIGWTYISKDGPKSSSSSSGSSRSSSGGSISSYQEFDSLEDFANSEVGSYYNEGVRFETSEEQDEKALQAAQTEAEEDYTIIKKNCTAPCREGLDAAGIEHNNSIKPNKLLRGLKRSQDGQFIKLNEYRN